MKLELLLVALLLAAGARGDDYILSEEDEEAYAKPAAGEDFMKQFACLIATQRLTHARDAVLKGFSSMGHYAERLKRMTANLYKRCTETVTDEVKSLVGAAKSRSDFDRIRFGVEDFDVAPYFREERYELTPDELEAHRGYLRVDRKVKDIQKKTMRENPDAENEEEDDQTYEEIKKRRQRPQIGGLDVDSALAKYTVLGFLTILGGFVYLLWKKLFLEENEREQQRAARRQKKKAKQE